MKGYEILQLIGSLAMIAGGIGVIYLHSRGRFYKTVIRHKDGTVEQLNEE